MLKKFKQNKRSLKTSFYFTLMFYECIFIFIYKMYRCILYYLCWHECCHCIAYFLNYATSRAFVFIIYEATTMMFFVFFFFISDTMLRSLQQVCLLSQLVQNPKGTLFLIDAWSMLLYLLYLLNYAQRYFWWVLLWGGVRLKYKVFYEPVQMTVYALNLNETCRKEHSSGGHLNSL